MISHFFLLRPSFEFYSLEERFQFLLNNIADFGIYEHISKFFEIITFSNSNPEMPS